MDIYGNTQNKIISLFRKNEKKGDKLSLFNRNHSKLLLGFLKTSDLMRAGDCYKIIYHLENIK